MWVRTQDKKQMLQVNSFSIKRNYGGKQKFALISTTAASSFFGNQSIILGHYTRESDALQNYFKGSQGGAFR